MAYTGQDSKRKNQIAREQEFEKLQRGWTPIQRKLYAAYRMRDVPKNGDGSVRNGKGLREVSDPYAEDATRIGYVEPSEQETIDSDLRNQQMIAGLDPQPHEDYNDWIQRIRRSDPEMADFVQKSYTEADFNAMTQFDPEKRRAYQLRNQLDEFTKEMMGPLNLEDPETARMLGNIESRIRTSQRNSGIGGGMTNAAASRGVGDAILGETARRKQIGLQALGMGMTDSRQLAGVNDAAAQRQGLVDYENSLQDFEKKRGEYQLGFGIAGGVIGAVAGGYASGGAGAVAGASAGMGIGAGIGGLAAGGPPQKQTNGRGGMTGGGY